MNSAICMNFFQAGINGEEIPTMDSISYLGIFSTGFYPNKALINNQVFSKQNVQISEKSGIDETLLLQISKAYVSPNFGNFFNENKEKSIMLGCQLYSKYDGIGNRSLPIDLVILLDISSSMKSSLGKSDRTCIDLAKSAILKLKNKMNVNDKISLITFNDRAEIIFDLQPISEIQNYEEKINSIKEIGSTIISSGIQKCLEVFRKNETLNLKEHKILLEDQKGKKINRLKRIILLTDMNDTEGNNDLENGIKECAENNIFISIIGIGFSLNLSLTEKVSKNKGFNYFSALEEEHLDEIIVKNFDLNFFPIAYDIQLELDSGDIVVEKVYGTNFNNNLNELDLAWKTSNHILQNFSTRKNVEFMHLLFHRLKNKKLPKPIIANLIKFWEFKKITKNFCEISSCSATEIKEDRLKGKFFLLKCKLSQVNKIMTKENFNINAKINLSYMTLDGQNLKKTFFIKMPINAVGKSLKKANNLNPNNNLLQKFIKEEISLYIEKDILLGLGLFYYAKLMRKILRAYEKINLENYKEFLDEDNLNNQKKLLEDTLDYLLSDKYKEEKIDMIDKITNIIEKVIEIKKHMKDIDYGNISDEGFNSPRLDYSDEIDQIDNRNLNLNINFSNSNRINQINNTANNSNNQSKQKNKSKKCTIF